jgi:hypothetical protein
MTDAKKFIEYRNGLIAGVACAKADLLPESNRTWTVQYRRGYSDGYAKNKRKLW